MKLLLFLLVPVCVFSQEKKKDVTPLKLSLSQEIKMSNLKLDSANKVHINVESYQMDSKREKRKKELLADYNLMDKENLRNELLNNNKFKGKYELK